MHLLAGTTDATVADGNQTGMNPSDLRVTTLSDITQIHTQYIHGNRMTQHEQRRNDKKAASADHCIQPAMLRQLYKVIQRVPEHV